MKTTARTLAAVAGILAVVCVAQTDCESSKAESLAECSTYMLPCWDTGVSSSSSEILLKKRATAAASSGSSDICNCFYEYSRCFSALCPNSTSATIAEMAGVSEDECKDKSPDCYYMVWGDPHFVVASAGGKVKTLSTGGRSKAGERHFTCGTTAYDNLYSSDTMKVTATAEPMGGASILVSVTVTLQPSGTVYTTSKSSYGFDTTKTTTGYIISESTVTVKATNERIVVYNNWGYLTAEIYGYCNTTSTVQTGCDADDDDKDNDVIGGHWRGGGKRSTRAEIMARTACSAVGAGFVAACELDVATTGDATYADQALEATTRLETASKFLETYAAVPAATAAGATATAAIAAGVAGGVAGVAALAGGVGAAMYVAKKRRENSDASEMAQAEVSEKPPGVNVMNPKPGVHQSITGRAPPVQV
eukprot:m51a1_g6846 hypothetical protein (421) ;mRNA; r:85510-86772